MQEFLVAQPGATAVGVPRAGSDDRCEKREPGQPQDRCSEPLAKQGALRGTDGESRWVQRGLAEFHAP